MVHEKSSPLDQEVKARGEDRAVLSPTRSTASAITLKADELVLVLDDEGMLPVGSVHGYGLYYRDMRFLKGYKFQLGGTSLAIVGADATLGYRGEFVWTELKFETEDDAKLGKDEIVVRGTRVIDPKSLAVVDRLSISNMTMRKIDMRVDFDFEASFEDIRAVRSGNQGSIGNVLPPEWHDSRVMLKYEGRDGVYRSLSIDFVGFLAERNDHRASYELSLGAREVRELEITIRIASSRDREQAFSIDSNERIDLTELQRRNEASLSAWRDRVVSIDSDERIVKGIVETAVRDLHILSFKKQGLDAIAAGVPWFVALFGRDSLIVSLETLPFAPQISEDTLRLLARYQGTKVDPIRDEEPGKIMHELRVGEYALSGRSNRTPYYGTVDATPLYLCCIAEHTRWSGSMALFDELRVTVEQALNWIDEYGDHDGDGFVDYERKSEQGLRNQGWKDSDSAMVNMDGSLCEPPIALVEVQGYVYAAKLDLAEIFERKGEGERALLLRRQAAALKERFNRAFWSSSLQYYVMAIQKNGRPAQVVSSNPGNALWTGIIDDSRVKGLGETLLSPPLFSGWGVRTLASTEARYNPIGYHLGAVWPHDNALIMRGLRRYGRDPEFDRIAEAMIAAAQHFRYYRLPEVFAGYSDNPIRTPVTYTTACHPQAWGAGGVVSLVALWLGLQGDGFRRTLKLVRPRLPRGASWLEVRGIRLADSSLDLRLERQGKAVQVEILKNPDDIGVEILGDTHN